MKITKKYLRSIIIESLQEIENAALTPTAAPQQMPADVNDLINKVLVAAGPKYASIILNDIMLAFKLRNQINKELAITALTNSMEDAKNQKQTKLETAINNALAEIKKINFITKDLKIFNKYINQALISGSMIMENLEEGEEEENEVVRQLESIITDLMSVKRKLEDAQGKEGLKESVDAVSYKDAVGALAGCREMIQRGQKQLALENLSILEKYIMQ